MTPVLWWAGVAVAQAAPVVATDATQLDLGGDLKSFTVATFPYEHDLLTADAPQATGSLDGRAKFELRQTWGAASFDLSVHQTLTASTLAPSTALAAAGGDSSTQGFGTGVGATAPEAVTLTFDLVEPDACDGDEDDCPTDGNLRLRTRTDRLVLTAHVPHLDLRVGRQPVTFGRALFFTPLDLVNPFHPAVIDQEYKPGVDAARADVYVGMATQFTAVAAYAGAWDLDGSVLAAAGQTLLGLWDVSVLVAAVHGDGVLGLGTSGSIGPVAVRAEATGTLPAALIDAETDEDPFVRAVVGADVRPTPTTTVSVEAYVQTMGASDPGGYLRQATDPRYTRGELWALGRAYGGLSVAQEIRPTLFGSVFGLVNLADASALVGPNLAWSVADNAEVAAGAYLGLGARPGSYSYDDLVADTLAGVDPLDAVPVESEFGLSPTTAFAQFKAYF